MNPPLIEIRDLAVEFQADEGLVEAVKGVSLTIPQNRTVALVGESGSGKTVISQAILGILPKNGRISGGQIIFHDPANGGQAKDLAAYDSDHPLRRSIRGGRISIIFQEPMSSLSPLHTIGDQIGEALHLHRDIPRSEGQALVAEMLGRVGFPNPEAAGRHYPFELSGGLRQRAMIAMALICHPVLLIADEPTTALDVTIQAQILKLMKDLQAELDMSILFITHDLGIVANMAQEVVVMYRGQIMESGECTELIYRPEHPYLKALLHAVPRLAMKPDERLTPLREVKVEGATISRGRRLGAMTSRRSGPILSVRDLLKTFVTRRQGLLSSERRVITAVEGVTFDIERGESFAIVGESGSGKTTVSKIIMRALVADAGAVTFQSDDGPIDVLALSDAELGPFRRHIQYIFQDPFSSLNPRMSVYDIIAEPLVIHGLDNEEERRERVKLLLEAVGLDVRHLRRYPHSFSGGQRQRIGIARALALSPEILICDEPVSALDVSVQAQILNLLKDLQAELGLTYLFISHNLAVVKYIAQRIGVMCAGRMVEVAPTNVLFDDPRHPYTQALLAAVPEPDPACPLDFEALMSERASVPSAWPEPFTVNGQPSHLIDVGGGHFVRMTDDTEKKHALA